MVPSRRVSWINSKHRWNAEPKLRFTEVNAWGSFMMRWKQYCSEHMFTNWFRALKLQCGRFLYSERVDIKVL
jgi:hypothetical protein